MDSIPQNVPMPAEELRRAVAITRPANEKVRRAADARLRFEDEPASYTALLKRK